MPIEAYGFLQALFFTFGLVAVTATLGRLGRRRAHIGVALLTTAALVYAVYLAEQLGRALLLPRLQLLVHLVFANLAAVAFVALVATGTGLYRRDPLVWRPRHRRAVAVFVVLAVCATMTGTYMLTGATPRTP